MEKISTKKNVKRKQHSGRISNLKSKDKNKKRLKLDNRASDKQSTGKEKKSSTTVLCSTNWKALQVELKKDAASRIVNSSNERKFSVVIGNSRKRTNEAFAKENHTVHKKAKCLNHLNNNLSSDFSCSLKDDDKTNVWFDDVEEADIKAAEVERKTTNTQKYKKLGKYNVSTQAQLEQEDAFDGATQTVAMDCEMVGVGEKGRRSALARVSIVNQFGKCIYDKFVKPNEKVTDYRTFVSGIRAKDLVKGEDFISVQKEVSHLLKGRLLVGHALWNDLKALLLDHPQNMIRDTASYRPFYSFNNGKSPSLRILCSKLLDVQVQRGEHSSVQDAQAAMRVYMTHKHQWELAKKRSKKRKAKTVSIIMTGRKKTKA